MLDSSTGTCTVSAGVETGCAGYTSPRVRTGTASSPGGSVEATVPAVRATMRACVPPGSGASGWSGAMSSRCLRHRHLAARGQPDRDPTARPRWPRTCRVVQRTERGPSMATRIDHDRPVTRMQPHALPDRLRVGPSNIRHRPTDPAPPSRPPSRVAHDRSTSRVPGCTSMTSQGQVLRRPGLHSRPTPSVRPTRAQC
jgi:hypothetical protein